MPDHRQVIYSPWIIMMSILWGFCNEWDHVYEPLAQGLCRAPGQWVMAVIIPASARAASLSWSSLQLLLLLLLSVGKNQEPPRMRAGALRLLLSCSPVFPTPNWTSPPRHGIGLQTQHVRNQTHELVPSSSSFWVPTVISAIPLHPSWTPPLTLTTFPFLFHILWVIHSFNYDFIECPLCARHSPKCFKK